MSLEGQGRLYGKIRRVFSSRFMDSLCDVWRFRGYEDSNEGAQGDYGDDPAYSDVPCRLRQNAADGAAQKAPGLTEMDGTITLPIACLGMIGTNDRIEITTMGTNALPSPIRFAIIDQPRPIATGLSCRVKAIHGGASNA